MSYEQAYADHKYLWEVYGPAADMTGGYVDQRDLSELLASPTKRTAARCLERQIVYWFDKGTEDRTFIDITDPTLVDIAERYGCDLSKVPGGNTP